MTVFKTMIVFLFLLLVPFYNLAAHNKSNGPFKYEIGMDFVRYNRSWIYYNSFLQPINTNNYDFDLRPNFFAKIHFDYFSLRLKYEHFKSKYLFKTNNVATSEEVDGTFSNNRYLVGIEKCLIDKRIKSYVFLDLGLSETNFKGYYSTNQIVSGVINNELFNIDGIGISCQSGFGIKYRLFSNLYVDFESSIYLEKGFEKSDPHFINPQNKLIPRPISLFGFSTYF